MLRIALITLIGLAIVLPQTLTASIYGVIKGTVTDENGNPAIGASVQLVGTTQGANVKVNGKYAIAGVRAGSYELKVSSVGYDPIIRKVKVSADESTVVDVQLSTGSVNMDEIVVEGEQLVNKYQVGAQSSFSDSELQKTARSSINSLVTLSSGVVSSANGDGFNIRGTRSNDTQVMVDGLDVGNQFTGGFGASGTAYYPMVSSYATQEVQVKKGGFGAQYGNSMGGQVNTVVKTGRDDKYEGFITYRTDLPSLNGSQGEGASLVKNGNVYDVREGGEGLKLAGDNLSNVEFGVGGPIPGLNEALKNATFYLTGRYENREFRNSSYELYAPTINDKDGNYLLGGENLGQLDNQSSWVKNVTGRMKFGVTDNISLTVGGQLGVTSLENQDFVSLYMNDIGVIDGVENGVEERVAKRNVTNSDVNNAFIKINHSFPDASAFYDLKISTSVNNDYTGRRAVAGAEPDFFTGFELLELQDEWGINSTNQFEKGLKNNFVDQYEAIVSRGRLPNDGFAGATPLAYANRNPVSGYIEYGSFTQNYDNAYGAQDIFESHRSYGFEYRKGGFFQVDGSFTKIFQGDKFEHNIQTGFEFRTSSMGLSSNANPLTDINYDVYTSDFGGNIYASSEEELELTSEPKTPYRAALYVQDQVSYEGIIITPGLRFDMFDANSEYRTELNPLPRLVEREFFAPTETKYMISPRLNVSYPITDQSVFKMNFGIYYQMPQLQYMYDATSFNFSRLQTKRIGNPNLDPQRTNQYQVAYSSALTDDFALDVSAYYNDIYNQLGYAYVAVSDPYYLAQVGQYGTNKGVEIDLRRRVVDNIGFRVAYTLASIRGTSENETSNASLTYDPITQEPIVPIAAFRFSRDITHRANVNLNFQWGDEEGPSIGGISFLENAYATFTGTFRSGAPYTLTEINGNGQLSERNALEGPSRWQLDTRIGKEFKLSDIFGDGMGNSSIELYVDIFNITNRTVAEGVYTGTQSSLNDGQLTLKQIGSFDITPLYAEADGAIPTSFNVIQYNVFGERKYFIAADTDNSGIVTQEEKYENYVNAYNELIYKRKPNFQLPRSLFFGAVIRF